MPKYHITVKSIETEREDQVIDIEEDSHAFILFRTEKDNTDIWKVEISYRTDMEKQRQLFFRLLYNEPEMVEASKDILDDAGLTIVWKKDAEKYIPKERGYGFHEELKS